MRLSVDGCALEAHGPYMSESDEAEIIRRVVASDDVAIWRCGLACVADA